MAVSLYRVSIGGVPVIYPGIGRRDKGRGEKQGRSILTLCKLRNLMPRTASKKLNAEKGRACRRARSLTISKSMLLARTFPLSFTFRVPSRSYHSISLI